MVMLALRSSALRAAAPRVQARKAASRVVGDVGTTHRSRSRSWTSPAGVENRTLLASRGVACYASAGEVEADAVAKSKLYVALERCEVYRCDGSAEKLRRDVKPKLDDAGIKLLMVSIGTASSGEEFARGTDFPADGLFASEDNACYDALNFYSGLMRTFFDKSTANAMQRRFSADGAKDLKDVMSNYKMLPPKQNTQTLIQGGVVCFDGTQDVFFHKDEGTGAHADFDEAIAAFGV